MSEPFLVTAAERPGGLGEQRAEIDPADTRHGSQDRYVWPLKAFSRCLLDFANGRAELIEFSGAGCLSQQRSGSLQRRERGP